MATSSEERLSAEDAVGGDDRQVRVIVDPEADADAIARHLERFGCRVVALHPRGLVLRLPNASGGANAEAEANLYLAMWHAHHPSSPLSRATRLSETA